MMLRADAQQGGAANCQFRAAEKLYQLHFDQVTQPRKKGRPKRGHFVARPTDLSAVLDLHACTLTGPLCPPVSPQPAAAGSSPQPSPSVHRLAGDAATCAASNSADLTCPGQKAAGDFGASLGTATDMRRSDGRALQSWDASARAWPPAGVIVHDMSSEGLGLAYTFAAHPGLVYLPRALDVSQQLQMAHDTLWHHIEPPANTNHTRLYGHLPGLMSAAQAGLRLASTSRKACVEGQQPAPCSGGDPTGDDGRDAACDDNSAGGPMDDGDGSASGAEPVSPPLDGIASRSRLGQQRPSGHCEASAFADHSTSGSHPPCCVKVPASQEDHWCEKHAARGASGGLCTATGCSDCSTTIVQPVDACLPPVRELMDRSGVPPGSTSSVERTAAHHSRADGMLSSCSSSNNSSSSSHRSSSSSRTYVSTWCGTGDGHSAEHMLAKLRWATLGPQYDWTARQYDHHGAHRPLPPALCHLASRVAHTTSSLTAAPPASHDRPQHSVPHAPHDRLQYSAPPPPAPPPFSPDAALVSFYPANGALCGHRDDVEPDQAQPIVSISLGAAAVFLMGFETRHGCGDECLAAPAAAGGAVVAAADGPEESDADDAARVSAVVEGDVRGASVAARRREDAGEPMEHCPATGCASSGTEDGGYAGPAAAAVPAAAVAAAAVRAVPVGAALPAGPAAAVPAAEVPPAAVPAAAVQAAVVQAAAVQAGSAAAVPAAAAGCNGLPARDENGCAGMRCAGRRPLALMVHSGDILVLGGAARRCFHGIPRILTDVPLPEALQPGHVATRFEATARYLATSRINISVRAIT